MRAECFKLDCFFVRAHESGDRNRRKQRHLRASLRHGDVAKVADLAMLLVRLVTVPVPGRLHGKQAHRKN